MQTSQNSCPIAPMSGRHAYGSRLGLSVQPDYPSQAPLGPRTRQQGRGEANLTGSIHEVSSVSLSADLCYRAHQARWSVASPRGKFLPFCTQYRPPVLPQKPKLSRTNPPLLSTGQSAGQTSVQSAGIGPPPPYLSGGTLAGLFAMHRHRFLTVPQFAKVAQLSISHSRDVLHRLEARGALGHIGYFPIPGLGRAPKVYYLRRRGFEYLLTGSEYEPEELGEFRDVHRELTWSPQMYHRLLLLDLIIALETQVRDRPNLKLLQTFLEYRRVKGTAMRETADYVTDEPLPENRIVPDAAFVLQNFASGRRGLFFLEADMGTEQIAKSPKGWGHPKATIWGKSPITLTLSPVCEALFRQCAARLTALKDKPLRGHSSRPSLTAAALGRLVFPGSAPEERPL